MKLLIFFLCVLWAAGCPGRLKAQDGRGEGGGLLSQENLAAWCIVPFDAKKRGPEERAAMLERLGFQKFAYDYRSEHIPSFDAEMEALEEHGIELSAWWFPGELNDEAKLILEVIRRHGVHPQLWITFGVAAPEGAETEQQLIESEAGKIRGIAQAAEAVGCKVGLYNHGGWFGDPENQLAIIRRLERDGVRNVGIVYNLHHGHEQTGRFPALLERMKPYLLALNLNGMSQGGEAAGGKILPLGQGDLDLKLLRTILDSGWQGMIGILNHTDEDAEVRLQDNLDGLRWLEKELAAPGSGGERPQPRSWTAPLPEPAKTAN